MKVRDLPGWPPRWAASYTHLDSLGLRTDSALLVDARARDGVIVLDAEYAGRTFSGALPGDAADPEAAIATLRRGVGLTLDEVADLEVKQSV